MARNVPTSNRMLPILGLGESSIDYVYRVPQLPRAGSAKLPISSARVSPGGQVATALCACAALGLPASYIGALGTDENARLIRGAMQRCGVDTSHAVVREGSSRYAVILVEEGTGERVVLWHRDPAVALRSDDVPSDAIAGARLLHVDATDEEASIRAATLARDAGIPVTCDLDRVTARTRALLAVVTTPIFGEGVPETLTGEPAPERALRALRREHRGLLCVTLGARGAMLLEEDTLHRVEGHRVGAIDTTGAGDVFRGAFIYSLLRGDSPHQVLEFANAAAALSCTREGAITSVPSLRQVQEMIR